VRDAASGAGPAAPPKWASGGTATAEQGATSPGHNQLRPVDSESEAARAAAEGQAQQRAAEMGCQPEEEVQGDTTTTRSRRTRRSAESSGAARTQRSQRRFGPTGGAPRRPKQPRPARTNHQRPQPRNGKNRKQGDGAQGHARPHLRTAAAAGGGDEAAARGEAKADGRSCAGARRGQRIGSRGCALRDQIFGEPRSSRTSSGKGRSGARGNSGAARAGAPRVTGEDAKG